MYQGDVRIVYAAPGNTGNKGNAQARPNEITDSAGAVTFQMDVGYKSGGTAIGIRYSPQTFARLQGDKVISGNASALALGSDFGIASTISSSNSVTVCSSSMG